MSYLQVRSNGTPNGKPRVYFTCHPEDFDRTFEKVCSDILKTHNCAIYYTENMRESFPEENRETDLGRMNLFVIPVTFRLLHTPNRAMDEDFAFAKEHHIAVLPIMFESGIDSFYSAPDKFGELQYLSPYENDMTAIPYEEKLKRYLDSVLIDDKTAERIRAAFDAYVFLSYRKKDRNYANQLMRLIHKNPQCRDIAIWYDEFLTPGESFNQEIEKALEKSELFTLLVTPNLINEENYIHSVEYPMAQSTKKQILPVEMEQLDMEEFKKQYADVPDCVEAEDETAFRERLLESLRHLALLENENDPVHTYLIGLAYLNGIDVEVDTERAVELITKAAQAGVLEAIKQLGTMYHEGRGVRLDWQEELFWRERAYEICKEEYGEDAPETLTSLNNRASMYGYVGNYEKSLELHKEAYEKRCRILGEEHSDTLTSLNNLAEMYGELGSYEKKVELHKKVYERRCKILGEEHSDTLTSLNNLAATYGEVGNYEKGLELHKEVYEKSCKMLGEEHPETLMNLNGLAVAYGHIGNYKKELKLQKEVYEKSCKILWEEAPFTLMSLNNLAGVYSELGRYEKTLELNKEVYEKRCKVLGEEHPDTLTSLNNLAVTYNGLGKCETSLELHEEVYEKRCKVLGEEHPDTLISLNNLAVTYNGLGKYEKSLELYKEVYEKCYKVLGKEHPKTLKNLNNLAWLYSECGNYEKSLELYKEVYEKSCKVWGEENPKTLMILRNLAVAYGNVGKYEKSLEMYKLAYAKQWERSS